MSVFVFVCMLNSNMDTKLYGLDTSELINWLTIFQKYIISDSPMKIYSKFVLPNWTGPCSVIY